MVMQYVEDKNETLKPFQQMTLLDDMERLNLSRHKITLRMLTKLNTEKFNFYFPRKAFHDKLWNHKRKTIEGYAAALAFYNITMGPATIRELNGMPDSVDDIDSPSGEAARIPSSNDDSRPTTIISSSSNSADFTSPSTATNSSSKPCNPNNASSGTGAGSTMLNDGSGSASLNKHSDCLNEELENLTEIFSHISLKSTPAPSSPSSTKNGKCNNQSHSFSTTGDNDMPSSPSSSSPSSSSPPDSLQHSIASSPTPTTKHSNKTPLVDSTPPRTIRSPPLVASSSMSSRANFSLELSDASETIVTTDPFAFAFGEEDDVDYEGSEHNPFICCINTKYPERNRDGFHGHAVTFKRSLPNGDEYHFRSVVVTKTGNSADILDLELWKASIPQKGDIPSMLNGEYVGRSLLVAMPALDMMQRDAEKLHEGRDGEACQRTLEAFQATATRYNEYGSNGQTHGEHPRQKKYFLLVFENAVDFSYLSHDSNCHTVETHSNMATFKKDHRDLWNKIINTIQQDMTNAYWEVPFVGGRTKVVAKMTPKKKTAAQRKAECDAAKLKTPDTFN
jgi:hypothetical protein